MQNEFKETADEELMKAIAAGEEGALRELISRYQHLVYGTIVKMLGDNVEAEDLAQQVFVRVYRAAKGYRPTASFKTWLFTILRNLVFNEHRRRNRAYLESIQAEEHGSDSEMERDLQDFTTKTPAQLLLDQELVQSIDLAIAKLPEQQRLAVILRRYDEFSYEEIAAVLKTSVSATKSLLFRARETLRDELQIYLQEKSPLSGS